MTDVWDVIVTAEVTNLCSNPSFEVGTTGWSGLSATITRVVGDGVFGACLGRMLASGFAGRAEFVGPSTPAGTLVVLSAWVKSPTTSVSLAATGGVAIVTQAHPGDGEWHRLVVAITMNTTTTPAVSVVDNRVSGWTDIDIDGVQIETGVTIASTYIDGDQPGCLWTGAQHLSTSTRDARSGEGGVITTLDSLGFDVRSYPGVGRPPVNIAIQERAFGDGAFYQQTTVLPRPFTVLGLIRSTGIAALHSTRRDIEDALTLDGRTNRGPVLLRYRGNTAGNRLIRAYYEGGLEMAEPGAKHELIPARFLATDPYWESETDEQAAVTASQTLSPVSKIALRNTDGTWSTLGGGATGAVTDVIRTADELLDGRLVVGGTVVDFGGVTTADNLAAWDGSAWAVIGSAAPNGGVQSSALGNDGKLYVSGNFTTVGGVTVNRIASWDGTTWAVVGTGGTSADGLASGAFLTMAVDPSTGYLWAATDATGPTTAGGVTINGLGYWNGSAWVAVSQTGLPASWLTASSQSMAVGPDGRIYIAISSPTTKGIYVWGGSSWSLFAASTGTSNLVVALLSANNRLYAGGYFTGLGGVTVSNVAELSGSGVSSMGGGVVTSTAVGVRSLAATPDGSVYIAGRDFSSVGGITLSDSIAIWNGSSWRAFSADPPNTATPANDTFLARSVRSGRLLVAWSSTAGTFGTSMPAEAITTVTNNGSSNAYPVIRLDAAGTVYTIANLTTGQRINFNGCTLASGEVGTLDLRPGRKTFGTALRNLLSTILRGSDLVTFCLAPGENRISLMATAGTATMHWRPRHLSAD